MDPERLGGQRDFSHLLCPARLWRQRGWRLEQLPAIADGGRLPASQVRPTVVSAKRGKRTQTIMGTYVLMMSGRTGNRDYVLSVIPARK